MGIYSVVTILFSLISASNGYAAYDNYGKGASCYDCHYAPNGVKNDRGRWVESNNSGYYRCALTQDDDHFSLNKWRCQSERCFIRKDPNGLVYRGCADQWNLPTGIDTGLNCSRHNKAIWWFCDGHLCNDGALGNEDRCGHVNLEEEINTKSQPEYNTDTYQAPILYDAQGVDNDPATESTYDPPPPAERPLPSPNQQPRYFVPTGVEQETVHGFGPVSYPSTDSEYYGSDDQYYSESNEQNEDQIIIQDDQKPGDYQTLHNKNPAPSYTPRAYTYDPYARHQGRRGQYQAKTAPRKLNPQSMYSTPRQHYSNNATPQTNFWSWLWGSRSRQQLNPLQAYWQYLFTLNQSARNYGNDYSRPTYNPNRNSGAYRSHQNLRHGHSHQIHHTQSVDQGHQSQYAPRPATSTNSASVTSSSYGAPDRQATGRTVTRSQGTQYQQPPSITAQATYPWKTPDYNKQENVVQHESSAGAGRKSHVKLSIRPVEPDQDTIKLTQQTRGREEHYPRGSHGVVPRRPHNETRPNPCNSECYMSPGILQPDPDSPNGFIQCGPGVFNGQPCKCCQPIYHDCPRGTAFDDLHKVCNRVGGHQVEDRKYKSIDFY